MVHVIPGCTGSSRFSCDGTTVFCTIQGPSDGISRLEDPDGARLDIRWRDSVLINGRMYDKYFSGVMERILSRYMILELDCYKTIQINFNIVGEIRNALFCSVNAVLLALVDGGFPLRSMFYATSSFTCDEEVFVFGDGGMIRHSFGMINESHIEKGKEFLEYVKEIQHYTLKSRIPFEINSG